MDKIIRMTIVLPVLLSSLMAISLQFPVFDFMQGPYQYCIGRFEGKRLS